MQLKDLRGVIDEIKGKDVSPSGWRAVGGKRGTGPGDDLFLAHPEGGVYLIKAYAKNPFQVKGVGTEVARKVDEEVEAYIPGPGDAGRFSVQTPPASPEEAERTAKRVEGVLKRDLGEGAEPEGLFADVMDALGSPAYGPADYRRRRSEGLEGLADTFEEEDELLNTELAAELESDGVGREIV